MSLRRTYGAAVTVAGWQAIASALLTSAATLLMFTSRGRNPSAAFDPEAVLLDILYRLTTADVAALLVIIAFSINRLFQSADNVRRAIYAANPGNRATLHERMSTLCFVTILVCVLGLYFAPPHLLALFNKNWSVAILIFLWPMMLTILIAFFSGVLIAAFRAERPAA